MNQKLHNENDLFESVKDNIRYKVAKELYNNSDILLSLTKSKQKIEEYLIKKEIKKLPNKYLGVKLILNNINNNNNDIVHDSELKVIIFRKIISNGLKQLKNINNEYKNLLKKYSKCNPIIINDITIIDLLLKDILKLYI